MGNATPSPPIGDQLQAIHEALIFSVQSLERCLAAQFANFCLKQPDLVAAHTIIGEVTGYWPAIQIQVQELESRLRKLQEDHIRLENEMRILLGHPQPAVPKKSTQTLSRKRKKRGKNQKKTSKKPKPKRTH